MIFLVLLSKFAFKPIAQALRDREQSIENKLSAGERAKGELDKLKKQNEDLLKAARAEREEMLKEAKLQASKLVADAEESAKAQSNKIIQAGQEVIQNEKKAALAEVRNQVATLSVSIAEKLLQKELENKATQDKLVDDLLKTVSAN